MPGSPVVIVKSSGFPALPAEPDNVPYSCEIYVFVSFLMNFLCALASVVTLMSKVLSALCINIWYSLKKIKD